VEEAGNANSKSLISVSFSLSASSMLEAISVEYLEGHPLELCDGVGVLCGAPWCYMMVSGCF
jgi:hypothetical protein